MSTEKVSPQQQPPGEQTQSSPIEENVKSRPTWLRLVFMIIVVVLYAIARVVVGAVVVVVVCLEVATATLGMETTLLLAATTISRME